MKKFIRIPLFVGAAVLLSLGSVLAQFEETVSNEIFENVNDAKAFEITAVKTASWTLSQLDSIIETNMEDYHIPGVFALIIKDDQIVWSGSYGYANIEENIPPSDTTLFRLASISKTFVVAAVMQLWENGLIDLDVDINDYLTFPVINPNWPDSIITMRMLLSHTSSIDRNDFIWMADTVSGGDSPIPLGQYLEDYLVFGGPLYTDSSYLPDPPGTTRQYCNWAFSLAAYIVEEIVSDYGIASFEQYCQDSIFAPIGMTETSWFLSNLDTNNIAVPYWWDGSNYGRYGHIGGPLYPAGQLRTSAAQLVRHLIAFMYYGEIDGNRILDSTTIELMRTPQFPEANSEPDFDQGLAWFKHYGEYYKRWGHGGTSFGAGTRMFFNPDERTGFILLTNRWSNDGHTAMRDALDVFSRDSDMDGIIAGLDNCPDIYNPGQEDMDVDGIGDTCDCSAAGLVMSGEFEADGMGWGLSGAGDINNDGYDDIIVGARYNDDVGNNAGKAYVFSGLTGDTMMVITGEGDTDNFGVSVSGAGDINNDGFGDIIIGAHFNDGIGTNAGRAYIFHGSSGPYPQYMSATDAHAIYDGEAPLDNFGWQVSGLGDINGDSCSEIIISSLQLSHDPDLSGKVHIFSGLTGELMYKFTGEADGDYFGYEVVEAGLVNNDSVPDIIVGALYNSANGNKAGRAYVFYCSGGPYPIELSAASADRIFTGDSAVDRLGASVSGAGDVDNDGYDDLIVGAPGNDRDGANSGRAYVYSGLTGDTLFTVAGKGLNNYLGWAVLGLDDIDGDSYSDIAVGAPQAYDNGFNVGRAYIYSGQTKQLLKVFSGPLEGDRLGRHLASNFDFDGDGTNDLMAGTHKANADAGGAHLFVLGYDSDGDNIQAGCDNCALEYNPDQLDLNANGIGDICEFICGDANNDGTVNILDITFLISFLYKEGPAPESDWASDPNGDGTVNILDITYLISYLYKSGPPPACL